MRNIIRATALFIAGVAIIGILAAILLPAIAKTKARGRAAGSNCVVRSLRQIRAADRALWFDSDALGLVGLGRIVR